jgi:hypothetical protein
MYRVRLSNAIEKIPLNWAAVAGPPSPLKPFSPVPATTVDAPVRRSKRRTRKFQVSVT